MKVGVVVGVRPEVLKTAPLIKQMEDDASFDVTLVSTNQQPDLLPIAFADTGLTPDVCLNSPRPGALCSLLSVLLKGLREVPIQEWDLLMVLGDSVSSLAGALAGFLGGVPVVHLEAGLRSGDLGEPFPEEGIRRSISSVASWHFCPTSAAVSNLLEENTRRSQVSEVGNLGQDAIAEVLPRLRWNKERCFNRVLVTFHRRENLVRGSAMIPQAVDRIHNRNESIRFSVIRHPNPVLAPFYSDLATREWVELLEPLGHAEFLKTLIESRVVMTDSGGVSEEAALLKKHLLIIRSASERVFSKEECELIGMDEDAVVHAVLEAFSKAMPHQEEVRLRQRVVSEVVVKELRCRAGV